VYDGFLGQVQVYVPIGETIGSDASVLAMIDRNRDATSATSTTAASKGQERYRVYTNAKNKYTTYGSSLGLTYNFYKTFTVSGNVNYNDIKGNRSADLFVTGFNTPKWTTNLSVGNRAVTKNIGFNIVYKWQDSFLWESPLVTGAVAAINNIDAQITYRLPAVKSTIKIGGTDILNTRYIQYAGGPTIGALYYVAITVDVFK
jgi:iron complex outermembrane receptor protein